MKRLQTLVTHDVFQPLLKSVLAVIGAALFGLFLSVLVIEWLYGCGVFYTDVDGVRHLGECIWLR